MQFIQILALLTATVILRGCASVTKLWCTAFRHCPECTIDKQPLPRLQPTRCSCPLHRLEHCSHCRWVDSPSHSNNSLQSFSTFLEPISKNLTSKAF